MSTLALCGLSLSCFWTIIRKRSMLIISSIATPSMTKNQKSMAETRQKASPKIHLVVMTVTRAKGMLRMASIMSAKARLAKRMLMAERMADLWYTIKHTTTFPSRARSRMTTMTKQKKTCRGKPTPDAFSAGASADGVAASGGNREPGETFAMEMLAIDSLLEKFSSPSMSKERTTTSGWRAAVEGTFLHRKVQAVHPKIQEMCNVMSDGNQNKSSI